VLISGRIFVGRSGNYTAYLFCRNFPGFSIVETQVEVQKPLQKGEVVAAQGPKAFDGRVSRKTAAGAIQVLDQPWFFERVSNPRNYRACLKDLEMTLKGSGYVH